MIFAVTSMIRLYRSLVQRAQVLVILCLSLVWSVNQGFGNTANIGHMMKSE